MPDSEEGGGRPRKSPRPARLSAGTIRFYQRMISPLLGANCRYYPSCSQYAIDALNEYGFFGGWLMAIRRILRCHPWAPGGYDPVRKQEDA